MSTVLDVLGARVDAADAVRSVERRSLGARLAALRGARGAHVAGTVYWPIAVIYARATSTGRRQWIEHTLGAVDLVSGRIGLLDEEPQVERNVCVDPRAVIPPRLARPSVLSAWHDYHRDYIDRRRRSMSPPALAVERVEPVWLEHSVVVQGDRRFLVDPVSHRADPLQHFPWIEQRLPASHTGPSPTQTTKEHSCTA